MNKLLDIIKYDKQLYSMCDVKGKHIVEQLAAKLGPLVQDIIKYPDGGVAIMKDGNIYFDSFPASFVGLMRRLSS